MEEKNTMSFEEAMKGLEQIAVELEKGDLNLDQSVSKFEEGMKLSKTCNEILDNAQKRISILIKSEDGVTEEEFNAEN
jgi:exodeoxyribonuclease VII small subunit